MLSKTRPLTLDKTKQKEEFIARVPTCSRETQGYRTNEFQIVHRDFYEVNVQVIWLFLLFGWLPGGILTSIRDAKSKKQGNSRSGVYRCEFGGCLVSFADFWKEL